MKRKIWRSRFLCLIAALLLSNVTFALQDTLFVAYGTSTYLIFEKEVVLVDIGRNDQYLVKIESKCVFIKATREHVSPTSILVQHGEEYFAATLAYRPAVHQFLYDYRKKAVTEKTLKKHSEENQIDSVQVRKHFKSFGQSPAGKRNKSIKRHHLRLSLTHLQNDKWATYLRFTFQNGSSIDYEIDLITFERKEKRGKRFSENNVNKGFVEPMLVSDTSLIQAGKEEQLCYAIPLYGLSAKSYLKVSMREKNGSRMLTLKLPARYINQALIYQP